MWEARTGVDGHTCNVVNSSTHEERMGVDDRLVERLVGALLNVGVDAEGHLADDVERQYGRHLAHVYLLTTVNVAVQGGHESFHRVLKGGHHLQHYWR